jgi:hypothetical protein
MGSFGSIRAHSADIFRCESKYGRLCKPELVTTASIRSVKELMSHLMLMLKLSLKEMTIAVGLTIQGLFGARICESRKSWLSYEK